MNTTNTTTTTPATEPATPVATTRPYTVTLDDGTDCILWSVSRNAAMIEARSLGIRPTSAIERLHDADL